MRTSVRINKPVNAEITVVHLFAVVAAVGVFIFIFVFGIRKVVPHGVVCPFPDAASHKVVVLIEDVPVIFKTAGAHAHCVTVLTEEQRFAEIFSSPLVKTCLFTVFGACIHFGYNVIAYPLGTDYALVMHGYFGANTVKEGIADILTAITSRLVTE